MSAAQPPCATQAQIDQAERLARMFGLTYLSVEGYAKLYGLLIYVAQGLQLPLPADEQITIPKDHKGWLVG